MDETCRRESLDNNEMGSVAAMLAELLTAGGSPLEMVEDIFIEEPRHNEILIKALTLDSATAHHPTGRRVLRQHNPRTRGQRRG